MCVILVARKDRPSPEVVKACYETNADGAGIAFRDPEKPDQLVHWVKGITDLDHVQELVEKAPLPFIVHFRIQTVGGHSKGLTHPFVMTEDSPLDLQGQTTAPLVFHNGTWGAWRSTMFDTVAKAGLKIPTGKWSDSRAMAWLAAFYGLGLFDLINEKVAVISPRHLLVFGEHWSLVPDVGYASNMGWTGKLPKGAPYAASAAREPESEKEEDKKNDVILVKPADGASGSQGPFVTSGQEFNPKKDSFEMACELYGRGELSKNKWKKAVAIHYRKMQDQQSHATVH